MPKRVFDPAQPFQSIAGACRVTGLSQGYLRQRCRAGEIPFVMAGKEYRVNVPALLRQLEAESAANTQSSVNAAGR